MDADIKRAGSNTCVIDGWVALDRRWKFLWPWLVLGTLTVGGAGIGAAIAALVSGNVVGIPILVGFSALIGSEALFFRAGLRDYRREAAALAAALTTLLLPGAEKSV